MIALAHIRKAAVLAYRENSMARSGYFAVVTPHSPGFVRKVSPGDWAYLEYIRRVHSGEFGGDHVPKIRRLHEDGTGCIVIMERLATYRERDEFEDCEFSGRNVLDELTQIFHEVDDPYDDEELGVWLQELSSTYDAPDSLFEPGLARLCWYIGELCEEYGMHFDLHLNNIMVREDGTVVITDPVCDMNDAEPLEHVRWSYGSGTDECEESWACSCCGSYPCICEDTELEFETGTDC